MGITYVKDFIPGVGEVLRPWNSLDSLRALEAHGERMSRIEYDYQYSLGGLKHKTYDEWKAADDKKKAELGWKYYE